MRIIPDQLRSKNLVPFKKRHGRYKIPGVTTENQVLMDRVDPDLSAEEQTYVRHYLGYADALIRSAEENASSEPGEAGLEEGAGESDEDEQARPEETASSIPMDEPSPDEDDLPMRAA
ncbi:MAG: hypothetical protein ACJ71W_09660 [Terriglobales bacterium]|jgi:hypothetical protein